MQPVEFNNLVSDEAVVAAIRAAEARTSGEIRVFVSRWATGDPVLAGQSQFVRLGMERTAERHGVLIFVAPKSRNFAVIGDAGVHEKCGEVFWVELAGEMQEHFRAGRWTEGLTHGIARAGELLARHFPRRAGDVNELADAVERD